MKVYPQAQREEDVRPLRSPKRTGSVQADAEPMEVFACERRDNNDMLWLNAEGALTPVPVAHSVSSLRDLSDRVKASRDYRGGRVSVVSDPSSLGPIIELPPPSVDDQ